MSKNGKPINNVFQRCYLWMDVYENGHKWWWYTNITAKTNLLWWSMNSDKVNNEISIDLSTTENVNNVSDDRVFVTIKALK